MLSNPRIDGPLGRKQTCRRYYALEAADAAEFVDQVMTLPPSPQLAPLSRARKEERTAGADYTEPCVTDHIVSNIIRSVLQLA